MLSIPRNKTTQLARIVVCDFYRSAPSFFLRFFFLRIRRKLLRPRMTLFKCWSIRHGFREYNLTMITASETTRSSFPLCKLSTRSFDPMPPRLQFFWRSDPTNPFIPREWGDLLPCRMSRRISSERYTKILRRSMYRWPGHVLFHGMSITKICSPAGAVSTHVCAAQIFTALILSLLLHGCVRLPG